MQKILFIFAAISALLANGLGAFGSHALKTRLDPNLMAAYQTGVQYQFYHSLGLLLIGLLMFHISNNWIISSAVALMLGVILFSGSLYIVAVTGVRGFGIITPFGGISFIAGWTCLLIAIYKAKIA